MSAILADSVDIGSSGLVHNLLVAFIVGLAILVIWWGGVYFARLFEAPPIFVKVWTGLFVLLAIIFVVNFLMSLLNGHGFITW